ncbi:Aspartic peptidase, partial [Corchorus olitorius]
MWCATKFTPGHRCGVKAQLYQMFLEDSTEGSMDHDGSTDSAELVDDSQVQGDSETTPIISIYALLGAVGPQTMQVAGNINGKEVTILIDTGSTHNFLDATLAKKLGCVTNHIHGLQVQVANGKELKCQEICSQLQWEVQGLTQKTDVLLIQLRGCNMVLGIQWLKTLGPIWWDFSLLVMKFVLKGQNYKLTGLSAGEVKLISEKQAAKQGFSQQSLCTMLLYTGKPQLYSLESDHSTLSHLPHDLQELLHTYDVVFDTPKSLPP